MLAWIDSTAPGLFNTGSWALLVLFSALALIVSPLSPFSKDSRNRFGLCLPPISLICLLLFVTSTHHLEPKTFFAWNTNWGIICAFGIAFSIRLFRSVGFVRRLAALLFLVALGCLILFRDEFRPAVSTS